MTHWEQVCLITWALWGAQTIALAFWFLPHLTGMAMWQGYWTGRKHQRNGTPVPAGRLPIAEEGTPDDA